MRRFARKDGQPHEPADLNALLREVNNNPQRFIDYIKLYMFERKPPKEKKKKKQEPVEASVEE